MNGLLKKYRPATIVRLEREAKAEKYELTRREIENKVCRELTAVLDGWTLGGPQVRKSGFVAGQRLHRETV